MSIRGGGPEEFLPLLQRSCVLQRRNGRGSYPDRVLPNSHYPRGDTVPDRPGNLLYALIIIVIIDNKQHKNDTRVLLGYPE